MSGLTSSAPEREEVHDELVPMARWVEGWGCVQATLPGGIQPERLDELVRRCAAAPRGDDAT